MDFFAHQDRARRNTVRLVGLFGLVLLGVIGLAHGAAETVFGGGHPEEEPYRLALLAVAVCAVFGAATRYKLRQFEEGMHWIPVKMGGRPVDPAAADPAERRLVHIVEEMAIAAGVAAPGVYVLDEESSINAFAVGRPGGAACIVVTRGCLRTLDRDELQGVIAHEFSHLLNDDTRLNVLLTALLHGLLTISLGVLAHAGRAGKDAGTDAPASGESREEEAGGWRVPLGFLLMPVGLVGAFLARLIKCAIGRQREFLADAAAVQFTRNAEGLAGALKKIGGYPAGALVLAPYTAEISHFFFCAPLEPSFFNRLFSTHPLLERRIRRLDPRWDGTYPATAPCYAADQPTRGEAPEPAAGASHGPPSPPSEEPPAATPLAHAQALREALPVDLLSAAHAPETAVALIYALLLDGDAATRQGQWDALRAHVPPALLGQVEDHHAALVACDVRIRLPLVEIALPALRGISAGQYAHLAATLRRLIAADERLSLFEFVLQQVVQHRLAPVFRQRRRGRRGWPASWSGLRSACYVLLSALAHAARAPARLDAAYRAGWGGLPAGVGAPPAAPAPLDYRTLGPALDRLAGAPRAMRRAVLAACTKSVMQDGAVTTEEAELLRAVALILNCPMPPFLPDAAAVTGRSPSPPRYRAPRAVRAEQGMGR